MTSNLDEGLSTANVTFDPAKVTDNSQVEITPIPSIQSGSIFDEGENEVRFNATDPSGNTGTCLFTVTVKGVDYFMHFVSIGYLLVCYFKT